MTLAALAIAALSAVLLAWRKPSTRQRRIAGALCLLLALDVLRSASLRFRTVPPYAGLARASWAVSGAALLAWYAATAWAVWSVLLGTDKATAREAGSLRGPSLEASPLEGSEPPVKVSAVEMVVGFLGAHHRMLLALASLASAAVLFAAYPLIRGAPYMAATRAVFALALAAQALAVARFAARGQRPDAPQFVALLLALSSLASAAGPWAFGEPARDWSLARSISVVTFVVIAGVELWTLLRRRIGS